MSEGSPQNTDVPEVVPKFQNLSIDQPPGAPVQEQPPQPPADNNNTTTPPATTTTTTTTTDKDKIWCRLLIPSKVAGAIIGKGGATIKSLRDEYQAIINIPEARAPERVLKICVNSREKLDKLVSRIAEILKDEILKSGIRRKEGETELRILVQSSQAGAIIGTKGTTVKTLRESTGSRININPECCPQSTERVAAIMGRPETVVKCISMIYDILEKVPPKGSEQRYDPNCFDPTYDYGGFGFDPRAYFVPRPYYPIEPRGPPYIQPPYGPQHFPSGPYANQTGPSPYMPNPRFPAPNSPQDYNPGRNNPTNMPNQNLAQPQNMPPRGYNNRGGGHNLSMRGRPR